MSAICIKNAKVFDGKKLTEGRDIVIENGLISDKTAADTVIDGTGCTLLPGLIDSHVHVYDNVEYLKMAAKNGVTTMLDMGSRDPEVVNRMKNQPGLTAVLSSYGIGCAPDSEMVGRMEFPEDDLLKSTEDVVRFVNEQISYGADYLKLILEDPGHNGGVVFPPEIGRKFVEEAHKNKKLVVAHAVSGNTFNTGMDFAVDVLTHMPFDAALPQEVVQRMAAENVVSVPTLIMMNNICVRIKGANMDAPVDVKFALQSVGQLHKLGVRIFAGTDANMDDPTPPASVPYGSGMHDELALFVEAGMNPTEALTAATSAPAEYFGLNDRGLIEAGKRADLLLVEGDPTVDINAVRNVRNVWIGGMNVEDTLSGK